MESQSTDTKSSPTDHDHDLIRLGSEGPVVEPKPTAPVAPKVPKYIYILLGGILPGGSDGKVTSRGLVTWADPFVKDTSGEYKVKIYTWGQFVQAGHDIVYDNEHAPPHKTIVVGYSGGGSRAVWISYYWNPHIDLMILWDPSPKWQVNAPGPQRVNIGTDKILQFYNTSPWMPSPYGWLGGGYVGLSKGNKHTKIETVTIGMQHLKVQVDAMVRDKSWNEIFYL